jgi:hypothetical protein
MVQVRQVWGNESPHHHGSHRDLLLPPPEPAPTGREVDAVIVPTRRRTANLAEASGLAQALGCTLVTLHSGRLTTSAKAAKSLPAELDLLAIDIPRSDRLRSSRWRASDQLWLPRWETSALLANTIFARRSDLSVKRNLALMLSHMLGWSRILFIDDDITDLDPEHMRTASGLLDGYSAVGFSFGGFFDHSVVCYSYREAEGRQESFIGGGALAVQAADVLSCDSFFPDIYNDDWFFLLDGKGLLPTTTCGQVTQYTYDPFTSPQRARDQELGDVLAEGVYWLLDEDRPVRDANREHWAEFLENRRLFIGDVIQMVEAGELEARQKTKRIGSLKASLERLAQITPELCEYYIQAWARDREMWHDHLEQLPTGIPLTEAIAELTRSGTPSLTWHGGSTRALTPHEGERSLQACQLMR